MMSKISCTIADDVDAPVDFFFEKLGDEKVVFGVARGHVALEIIAQNGDDAQKMITELERFFDTVGETFLS